MRDILVIFISGILMVLVMIFALNMGKGSDSATGKGLGLEQLFLKLTRVEQADQGVQVIVDKRRENDNKIRDDKEALDRKMSQQRDKMEAAQERIRAMQERNDAQKARLEAQMERMRNR